MKAFTKFVAAATVLISTSAMAAEKPTVALVHGAFADSHSWDYVAAKLKGNGYRVLSIELPGRPGAPMAADKVSVNVYRDTVLKAISAEQGPVVLVGHSFGGITVSAVAEAAPEKIKTLVYVAAFLPRDTESMLMLAKQDRDSKAGAALHIDEKTGMASIAYDARADLFANGAPEGLRKKLPDLILDEPASPMTTPLSLTAARFGKVDKVYVHTAFDNVVSPYLQHKMVANTPVRMTFNLQTGHTPFLTDVAGVVGAIEKAAE